MEKIRCVACFNSLVDLWGEGQTEGISRIFFTPFFWQSVDDILVDEDSWGVGTQCITESTPDGNGYLTYRVRLQSKITE